MNIIHLSKLDQKPTLSIVMPCLNEEKTVSLCVTQAYEGIDKSGLEGEVIVCNNGSTDNSARMAKKARAKVVLEESKGYGKAYLTGIKSAFGQWIVLGDSDGTYDFREITNLIKPLGQGYDLVIGSRLKGRIKKGSMPFLNRYFGTPLLNLFLKVFFRINISDSQSGMRAFTKKAFQKLNLKTTGMEFASEMLIRAGQENLKITEIPISYSKRLAPTKLSRFRDAWRHVRFMFLFAPTYLFLIPGGLLMIIGLLGVLAIAWKPFFLLGHLFDFHSMILSSMLLLVGYQIIMLGIYAKVFSSLEGLNKSDLIIITTLRYFRLEKGLILGLLISSIGFLFGLLTFIGWAESGFGALSAIRPVILSMTLVVLGVQIIFSSFFLSILGLKSESLIQKSLDKT